MNETPSERIVATDQNIDALFNGVMIPVREPWGDTYSVPGWECRKCGWTVGAQGLPPKHWCPKEGDLQIERQARALTAARERMDDGHARCAAFEAASSGDASRTGAEGAADA